ncbi:FAD-dependent oxidoreductase [Enteractinococcus fodinae]|uniref:Succinate dehydrogenase/fumarate reductase flavoprotein subunit n=1 Tax=Enteractinococcus fodinae TaxID=684663 RepID=A0ABU2AXG2_9MICC|nr:FAD-dependent oxidoreductase [Enteractinococcus fodinae]MDR7346037.1 succinate dehydrogenase/fumarate reductase flavoprotein subunit [Enteractinococcus fodinae]
MTNQAQGSIGTVTVRGLPDEVDLAIIGSGGAGLMAGLTAAKEGARVLIVESMPIVGGATGISAGAAWIPAHGFAKKALGVHDSLDQARRYIYAEDRDQKLDPDMVEAFLHNGPKVARYIEEHTNFGWIPAIWPDYRSDIPGASVGRALFPGPYNPDGLGEAAQFVRPALTTGMAKNPMPFWLLGGVSSDDVWIAGPALVGALLEANLRNGVDVRVSAPATGLITEGSRVTGLTVEHDGKEHSVRTTRGVLIASGGFESAEDKTTQHLGAPMGTHVSPRGHNGIALQLADEIGAELTSMEDAWWMPGVQIPGETLDGKPLSRLLLGERSLPHSIIVNAAGKRFTNEAESYDKFGAAMRQVDPATGDMPNDPAWFVFDQNFWEKFGLFGVTPGGDVPEYVYQADSLSELAEQIDVDPVGLLRTVDEFNPEAVQGRDPWFNRGETLFDRYFGAFNPRMGEAAPDAQAPAATAKARATIAKLIGPIASKGAGFVAGRLNPDTLRSMIVGPLTKIMRPVLKSPQSSTLGPINKGPFYAIKVHSSALGTVGGPKTDAQGRVLSTNGDVVPGLFAAGNAGGAPLGGFYGGAGGTISLGLVFGHLAGRTAAVGS